MKKTRKSSLLKVLPLVIPFLFNQSYSQPIFSGHIGDKLAKTHWEEQGEALDSIEVIYRHLDADTIIANMFTNEEGNYYFEREEEPDTSPYVPPIFNLVNKNNILEARVFDPEGRQVKHFHQGQDFTNLPSDIASGSYFYKFIDDKNNIFTRMVPVMEGKIIGNNIDFPLKVPKRSFKKTANYTSGANELVPVEISIRDENILHIDSLGNNDYLGDFYDFKDTVMIDLGGSFEFNKDIIPVWNIEEDDRPDRPDSTKYRNSLHQIKHMTWTDPDYYIYIGYVSKWLESPIPLFYNRNGEVEEDCDINTFIAATDSSVKAWEHHTAYEDYRGEYWNPLNLSEESEEPPEIGGRMDYMERRSHISFSLERHIINSDTFYTPLQAFIYVHSRYGQHPEHPPIRSTSHELGHFLISNDEHSMSRNHVLAAGHVVHPEEGLLVRYIFLAEPFERTWGNLED